MRFYDVLGVVQFEGKLTGNFIEIKDLNPGYYNLILQNADYSETHPVIVVRP